MLGMLRFRLPHLKLYFFLHLFCLFSTMLFFWPARPTNPFSQASKRTVGQDHTSAYCFSIFSQNKARRSRSLFAAKAAKRPRRRLFAEETKCPASFLFLKLPRHDFAITLFSNTAASFIDWRQDSDRGKVFCSLLVITQYDTLMYMRLESTCVHESAPTPSPASRSCYQIQILSTVRQQPLTSPEQNVRNRVWRVGVKTSR